MAPYIDTLPAPSSNTSDPTLHHPRILCLHGGGTNAEIFQLQCRSLIAHLSSTFRLVFADGPHFCGPGPDVELVYASQGPFRRWLRWKPDDHAAIDDESAVAEIEYAVGRAMDLDPGDGEWVGLLGFSQGAKVAASLLYDVQMRRGVEGREAQWRFAVLMAGRFPLVCLSEYGRDPAIVEAGAVSEGFVPGGVLERKLSLPTLHVHGLRDVGLSLHRRMLDEYCERESAVVLEWDGGHRVPIKTSDVVRIRDTILELARTAGVAC